VAAATVEPLELPHPAAAIAPAVIAQIARIRRILMAASFLAAGEMRSLLTL
jgi:hypothetical protein